MNDLIATVGHFIKEKGLIEPGAVICAAISGGPDSTALLHLLHRLQERLNFSLTACHVNYRYRNSSGADALFAETVAADRGIPFRHYENSAPKPERGLQEEARDIRYRFFEELLADGFCDNVATGHTLDDSVETSLLWMIRGTGPGGFGGIRPRRHRYIRPLLGLRKEELHQWLVAEKIDYRLDASNETDEYRRNRIRRQVIPLLEKESPGALRAIVRLAELSRSQSDLIETMARKRVAAWRGGDEVSFPPAEVAAEPVALRYALYRAACTEVGLPSSCLTAERVAAMDGLLLGNQSGKRIELPQGFVALCDQRGFLITPPRKEAPLRSRPCRLPFRLTTIAGTLTIGEGGTSFNTTAIPAKAVIRSRREGDFITLGKGGGRKSLKTFFIDRKVPFHLRDQWPIIAAGSEVFYVAGHYMNAALGSGELTSTIMWKRQSGGPQ